MKTLYFTIFAVLMLLIHLPARAADPPVNNSILTNTPGLSVQDMNHLMQDHFQVSGRATAIPPAVLRELWAHDVRIMKALPIFAGHTLPDPDVEPLLKMADAGKRFNSTDCLDSGLPGYQLSFVALTSEVCFLSFETGGGWTNHVVLAVFHLSKTASGKDQATLVSAVMPNHKFKSLDELREAVEAHRYFGFDCMHYRLL